MFFTPLTDIGLLVLRLTLGIIFILHGFPKIKSPKSIGEKVFNGNTILGFALAFTEFFGGLAILFGLLTQLASFGIAIVMIGAMYYKITKWKSPFFAITQAGWEYDLVLFGIAITLILMGAGSLSLDSLLGF